MKRSVVRNALIAGAAAVALGQPVAAQETDHMSRAQLDGIELEYAVSGNPTGETVLLIHAGVFHDWWGPLIQEPTLAEHYRLVRFNRVGYGASSRLSGPVSIADHAAHALALMRYLGIDRAHVVGHSSSADIGLQLALDAPDAVASLTLLEPARPDSEVTSALRGPGVGMALELFHGGRRTEAVDRFLQTVAGPDYRSTLENVLPDAFAQAEAHADTFFGIEMPSLVSWSFTQEDARRVEQPVLAVLGAESGAVFAARHELLLGWLPNVEAFVLPEANHLLYLQNPGTLASVMAEFFARHPVAAA